MRVYRGLWFCMLTTIKKKKKNQCNRLGWATRGACVRAKDTSLCMHVLCLGWGKGATTNFAGWTCDRWPVTKAQHGDVLLWDNVYSSAQNDCVHHETLFCHGMANDQDPTRRRFQSHPTLQPTRCDCECVGPCFFFCFVFLNFVSFICFFLNVERCLLWWGLGVREVNALSHFAHAAKSKTKNKNRHTHKEERHTHAHMPCPP